MFRFATWNDRESLFRLWNSCFGDGEDYVYPFLNRFLMTDNVYVYEDKGEIVSAVYALDCEIKGHKGIYFYAVATDENYRKQGLARHEMEFLIDYKTGKGAEVFLLTPSNEKNRNYYAKLGFSDFFYCEKRTFEKSRETRGFTDEYSFAELFSLREKVFGERKFVSFPKKHFDFALMFSEKIFAEKEGGKCVAYALVNGKNITELCCEKDADAFVSAVLEKIGAESAEVFVPIGENTRPDSCKIPRGMVYCSNKDLKETLSENTFLSLNLE